MPKSYNMKPIKKKELLKALFFNEIDNTIRTPEEKFVNFGENPNLKSIKKDESITYEYNSLGFRSDEFIKDHDGKHILFSGCSQTEGVGGNLDSCWSYITYSELSKENKLSGFFNLARYGWGYDIIISNIMTYINIYGKPDQIFILFPNIGRSYMWKEGNDENFEIFYYQGSVPNSSKELDNRSSWKKRITVEEQRSHFIVFTMLIKLFEEYCITNNIDLKWSTWDREDADNCINVGIFKKFVDMSNPYVFIKNNSEFFLNNIKIRKDWERKRDGHSGYLFHYNWSQSFLGKFDSKEQ
jgi:hypothetical protein